MRTISRRLYKLEDRIGTISEPLAIQIQYVSPDGEVRDGPLVTLGGCGFEFLRLKGRHGIR